jgi:hypothetical protein
VYHELVKQKRYLQEDERMKRCIEEAPNVQYFLNEWEDGLRLYPLEGLLPIDQELSVNTSHLVISLISRNSANGNLILLQRRLAEPQMRLLLTLLQSPSYSPHEILYASLFCSYQGLLAGLFFSKGLPGEEWQATIEEKRVFLQSAHESGTWKRDLKPLYNGLSKLRDKLRPFGLGITVSASGAAYALIALPFDSDEARARREVSPQE